MPDAIPRGPNLKLNAFDFKSQAPARLLLIRTRLLAGAKRHCIGGVNVRDGVYTRLAFADADPSAGERERDILRENKFLLKSPPLDLRDPRGINFSVKQACRYLL